MMRFREFVGLSHTDELVIFDGYHGDDQEPVCTVETLEQVKAAVEMYSSREVAVFEAVDDKVYVWLDDTEERLRTLARKLIDKLWNDEDDAEMVVSILREFGFDYEELNILGVCDEALWAHGED